MNDYQSMRRFVGALGRGEVRENYIIPGLTSTLLASPIAGGIVRLFEMSRHQEVEIVPHDHRYDFQCYVLEGEVRNRLYCLHDSAAFTHAVFLHDPGTHDVSGPLGLVEASFNESTYLQGDWYDMKASQFHSIWFGKGAKVLLIEGPKKNELSRCLMPYVNGRVCDTFYWRDWMMAAPQENRR
jgi:hypothetical protein